MGKETYFVIRSTEDVVTVTPMDRAEVIRQLNTGGIDAGVVAGSLPTEKVSGLDHPVTDVGYWGTRTLIIKGSIVTPVEKTTVTYYDVP